MDSPSIYRLLGIQDDAGAERLRAAYEDAVAEATRRGDWSRAAALSAAFDALPTQVRTSVYSGRERDAARWSEVPGAVQRRPRSSASRRLTVIAGVGATLIALLAGYASWLSAGAPQRVAAAPSIIAAPTFAPTTSPPASVHSERPTVVPTRSSSRWSPMKTVYPGSGQIRIPVDAWLDKHGMAEVLCPDGPNGGWRPMSARPGAYFVCPSGYVGLVRVEVG